MSATPISHLRERLDTVRKAVPETLSATSILWLRGYNGAPDWATSLDAMLFAQDHRVPTLNGYSRNAPPYTLLPAPCMTPAVQLAAWARFSHMPPAALLERVVTVSLSPCRSVPPLAIERIAYLDSVGMLASLGNKLLRSAMPTATQIKVWDKLLVPVSRVMDPILLHRLGKSVLAVWRRG